LADLAASGLAWSPEGKYLAVADGGEKADPGGANQIFYISVESGERREPKIELPGQFVQSPTFSPDGKELAFISGPEFLSNDVYVASVSGGRPQALTSLRSSMGRTDWTPTGRELVFDSDHQGSQPYGGFLAQAESPNRSASRPTMPMNPRSQRMETGSRFCVMPLTRTSGKHRLLPTTTRHPAG